MYVESVPTRDIPREPTAEHVGWVVATGVASLGQEKKKIEGRLFGWILIKAWKIQKVSAEPCR